jgi:CDP-diacylglycerol--glycerol-3-phosphate 3-phosphatidyltransferase
MEPSHKELKITPTDKILAATFLQLIPARVTPNQVTIFRFFTVPFITLFLYLNMDYVAVPLFAVSALTDALDGALARTRGQVTEWGKMFDPVADKLLIGLSAIVIIPRYLNPFLVFIIIFTEMLLVGSAYYFKNTKNIHISANVWGKAKMIFQSLGIGLLISNTLIESDLVVVVAEKLIYFGIVLAVVSLISYGI